MDSNMLGRTGVQNEAERPIMLLTHPRSCSTAFERAILHHDDIVAVHEAFHDAFFYGPELLHPQYANDESARQKSGCSNVTYKVALDKILESASQGKRVIVKEIARVIMPFSGGEVSTAPSLCDLKNIDTAPLAASGISNPSILPDAVLGMFEFVVLIRHPRLSVPSNYRLTIPPLSEKTGWHHFYPENVGLHQLRQLFDYLKTTHNICVIDAEDFVANPAAVMRIFCETAGLSYAESMLEWDTPESRHLAEKQFGTHLRPWHEAAINSTALISRSRSSASMEMNYIEWLEEFGREGADIVRANVEENLEDYEYMKRLAIKL